MKQLLVQSIIFIIFIAIGLVALPILGVVWCVNYCVNYIDKIMDETLCQ